MGFLDGARASAYGSKAYKLHAAANKLSDEGKPEEAKQKYQVALQMYNEADKLGLNRTNLIQAYEVLLLREGEFEKARELMLRQEKRKDLTKEDWFNLRLHFAIYQWRTGQLDKAIETMERAGHEKQNGAYYSTQGMFLVDKARATGDAREALEFNLKALDYDDEDASTLDNMGQLYDIMSRTVPEQREEYHQKAIDFFKKAHVQKPRQITTIYYLAKLRHEDGDDERARKLLAKTDTLYFSKLCPDTPEMMAALKKEVG